MKKMMVVFLSMLVFIALASGLALAQDEPYDVETLESDFEGVTKGLSEFFGNSLGGMSFIGEPCGYSFIKHIAIGAGGGAV